MDNNLIIIFNSVLVGSIVTAILMEIRHRRLKKQFNAIDKELTLAKFECEKVADTIALTEREMESYEKKIDYLQEENRRLEVERGELRIRTEENVKQLEQLSQSQQQDEKRLKDVFENIAGKILDERSQKLDKQNSETLKNLLTPFGDSLTGFRLKMEQVYVDEAKERHSLETQIKRLVEMNQRISDDANNLTKALKGNNKTQGNWGEMILEKILENSGLIYGKEGYELQNTLRDSNGNTITSDNGRRMIPDAIVHFPDNRNVIIDSKASLAAYINYCNSENDDERKAELKKHIQSIKNHIAELDVKSYESYVDGALDFVMMFIPNESAYVLAVQSEPNLWNEAYRKKILLISPTSLIASLKIVSDLWIREKQNKNIEEIISRGEKLYEKCRNFLESMQKIEKGLSSATKSYDEAMTRLSGVGGVVRQAEMLRDLGIKSKNELPIKSIEMQENQDGL